MLVTLHNQVNNSLMQRLYQNNIYIVIYNQWSIDHGGLCIHEKNMVILAKPMLTLISDIRLHYHLIQTIFATFEDVEIKQQNLCGAISKISEVLV